MSNLNIGKKDKTALSKLSKKQLWLIISKIFLILILLVGMGYAGWFTGDALKYNTKLGIEYTGGYTIQADVYDYTNGGSITGDPNGDAKQGLQILKNKLDPIGDQPLSLTTIGQHSIMVTASNSMYKSMNDFVNAVNRMGSIFIMKESTDSGNIKDQDLLLKQNDDKSYTRTKIHDIFTGAQATINKARKPIVNLSTGTGWADVVKAADKSKVWLWSDLGQMIDSLRNDFKNYSLADTNKAYYNYGLLMTQWNDIRSQIKDGTASAKFSQIFDYTYGNNQSGNFMMQFDSSISENKFQQIIFDKNFKWSVNNSEFMVNPNEDKNLTAGEKDYVLPFEPYARTFLADSMSSEIVNRYKSFVINYDDVKNNPNFQAQTANQISMQSQTESRKIANLVQGGLSGLVIKSKLSTVVPADITSAELKALEIILAVILVIVAIALISYFRLYGGLITITFVSSLFMVLYVLALLNVQIAPITVAAIVIGFGIIIFGLILMIKRYKNERSNNNIPSVTAIKIGIKQTLPMFIDALVLFVVLGLCMFWAGAGEIKSFAIALLITLFIGFVLMVVLFLLFIYLFVSSKLLTKFPWLDVTNFSLIKLIFKNRRPRFVKKLQSFDAKIDSADSSSDHEVLASELNVSNDGLMLIENDFSNRKMNINEKSTKSGRPRARWDVYRIAKWSPVFMVIVVVLTIAFSFTGVANFDKTISQGAEYVIPTSYLLNLDSDVDKGAAKEIDLINKMVHSDAGKEFKNYNFEFKTYQNASDGTTVLTIWVNISDNKVAKSLKEHIMAVNDASVDKVQLSMTDPVISTEIIKYVIIGLAIALIFVFVYTFFRLDWVQFISILVSGIVAVGLCLGIVIIVHVSISFSMVVVFAAIYCLAVTVSTLVMSKAKQKKKMFNLSDYDEFFNYEYNHRKNIRALKQKIHYRSWIRVWQRAHTLRKEDAFLSWKEARNIARDEINFYEGELLQNSKLAKQELKKIRANFGAYNEKHNFLFKAARLTIKDLLKISMLMGLLLVVVSIFLAIFSGPSFGFFITLIIGVILAIAIPFVIAIPIWVLLEKYRALNRVRVHNFLDSQRVDLDEQIVVGIND